MAEESQIGWRGVGSMHRRESVSKGVRTYVRFPVQHRGEITSKRTDSRDDVIISSINANSRDTHIGYRKIINRSVLMIFATSLREIPKTSLFLSEFFSVKIKAVYLNEKLKYRKYL